MLLYACVFTRIGMNTTIRDGGLSTGKQGGFMEILNKIMPLILTAIMSVNLSGCGNSTGANGSPPAETSAAHVEKSENVIIADDSPKTNEQQYKELSAFDITDWKLEDLTHNIIVDEYSLSFPCKINELPMAFTVIEADEKRDLPATVLRLDSWIVMHLR